MRMSIKLNEQQVWKISKRVMNGRNVGGCRRKSAGVMEAEWPALVRRVERLAVVNIQALPQYSDFSC
jgi:hypothetical protein